MNECLLIGRLTKDPESRTVKEDLVTTTFSIAVERENSKEVDYWDVVTWRQTAENCAKFLSKGSLVACKGAMQKRSYENKQGAKVTVVELVANKVKFLNKVEKKQDDDELY